MGRQSIWDKAAFRGVLAGASLLTFLVGFIGVDPTTSAPAGAAAAGPTSIVQLGDSIASGEGTLYGWTFDTKTGKWQGPSNDHPAWEGTYPDCHQSPDAYGRVVAASFPNANFVQLACTGATFAKGIAGPWSSTVPPEFGNWETRTGLNTVYNQANPDLVLVTLGADDVQFSDIVTQCAEYYYYHPLSEVQCTAKTPAGPDDIITKDFINEIPILEQHLQTLAGWIEARGTKLGSRRPPPKIVFTTYPDPLPVNPPPGGSNFCPDSWLLYNDQMIYFSSLVRQLDNDIITTVTGYATQHHDPNIAVVDLYDAYAGHQWCAKDAGNYVTPWAYGFSIYAHYSDLKNPNPSAFHPTPAGQRAIAGKVKPVVQRLFKG